MWIVIKELVEFWVNVEKHERTKALYLYYVTLWNSNSFLSWTIKEHSEESNVANAL